MAENLEKRKKDLEDIQKKIDSIEQSQASYDKRHTDRLVLKKKFEKQIKDLNKQQEILVKKIANIQKNSIAEATKELKLKKSVSDASKSTLKTEQEVKKSISGRLIDLIKLDFSSALQKKNVKEQLQETVKLKAATQDVATQIQSGITKQADGEEVLNRFSVLNVDDKSKMIELTKGLADGTYDITDLQSTQNSLSDEGKKIMQDVLAVGEDEEGNLTTKHALMGSIIAAKQAEKTISEGVAAEEEKIARLQQIQQTATVGIVALFGALLAVANKFGATIDAIGKQFGSLSVLGAPLKQDLLDASVEATRLGGGIEDVASITSTLASNFGINIDEAAKLSSKVFDTSVALGLSADEGANLFGVLMQTADLSAKQAERLSEGAFQLARQAGVAPQQVLKDIAASTETIAEFTKGGAENIAEAAVQARVLGVSLDTTAKISKGLLDFENSINNEIEASVMIGKQLNFQRARQLALEGDIAGATKDVVAQLGSEAEFNKLNVLQREALAKSIGVSVSELSKLVGESNKLTLSGAMAATSFEDLLGEEGISNISSLMNQFKALGATLINELGPTIETTVGSLRDFFTEGDNISRIAGAIKGVGTAFEFIAGNLPAIIGLMVTLKAMTMANAVAYAIMAVTGASAATAFSLGIGGAVVAGLIAAYTLRAKNNVKKAQTGITGFEGGPIEMNESGRGEIAVLPPGSEVIGAELTQRLLNPEPVREEITTVPQPPVVQMREEITRVPQPPVVQIEQPNFMPDFGLKDTFEKSFAMMSNEIKGLRQDTVNGQEQLSNIKIFTERGQIAAGFDPGFGSRNL